MTSAGRVVLKAVAYPLLLGGLLLALQRQDSLADIPEVGRKLAEVERLRPETVFVGSSHTYRHVDAALFDSLRGGGSSYNFGLPGAGAFEVHYWAERFLDRPYVKTLVVEVQSFRAGLDPENRRTRRVYYHRDFRRARVGVRVALASNLPWQRRLWTALDQIGVTLDHYLLLGQGGDVIAGLLRSLAPADGLLEKLDRQGFLALDTQLALLARADPAGSAAERAEVAETIAWLWGRHEYLLGPEGQEIVTENVRMLRQRDRVRPTPQDRTAAALWLDLYRQAEAQGVEVYFVEQVAEGKSMGISRLLGEAVAPGRLIILNDPNRYPNLLAPEFWYDTVHLNARGARWNTSVLAAHIPRPPDS